MLTAGCSWTPPPRSLTAWPPPPLSPPPPPPLPVRAAPLAERGAAAEAARLSEISANLAVTTELTDPEGK